MRRIPVALCIAVSLISAAGAQTPSCNTVKQGNDWKMEVPGASLDIRMDAAQLDMGSKPPLEWICNAARAVSTYYGRFPVPQAQVQVHMRGREGIGGTTWGGHHGTAGPYTRMSVGQHTSAAAMLQDWTMTHELTHMAFPQVAENQHWAEEGLATYLEPIERVQAGEMLSAKVWRDMHTDMQQGEPQAGDRGLDKTHTWARTYWGGAIFWFAADVAIYKQTGGKKSLRDAMRGIMNAGGTIEQQWTIERTLTEGDKATGTTVLMDEYKTLALAPGRVDLDGIWKELGINADGSFDDKAPLASFRSYVMQP